MFSCDLSENVLYREMDGWMDGFFLHDLQITADYFPKPNMMFISRSLFSFYMEMNGNQWVKNTVQNSKHYNIHAQSL